MTYASPLKEPRWSLLWQDEDAVRRLAERMRGLLEPFMLRRLKAEVAGQLAPKTQKLVQVNTPPCRSPPRVCEQHHTWMPTATAQKPS